MKKIIFISITTVLFFVLTSWLAPQAIGWYFDPPVNIGIHCREAVEWAMTRLVYIQAISIFAGVIVGSFMSFRFDNKKDKQVNL